MDIIFPCAIVGGMGLFFGIILALASKIFAVKTDERVPMIIEALPGANCGGCGYAGCAGYADAVVKGEAKCSLCTPGGSKSAERHHGCGSGGCVCSGCGDPCGDRSWLSGFHR